MYILWYLLRFNDRDLSRRVPCYCRIAERFVQVGQHDIVVPIFIYTGADDFASVLFDGDVSRSGRPRSWIRDIRQLAVLRPIPRMIAGDRSDVSDGALDHAPFSEAGRAFYAEAAADIDPGVAVHP